MKRKITNQQYKSLRGNAEFLALLKAGRALNSITFAMRLLLDGATGSSHLEQRQARKAITMLVGFCHEGRLLVERLRSEFSSKPYVTGFTRLLGPEFETERKLLREIRNTVSFHLDHEDRHTREVLAAIESLGENDDDEVEFYESDSGSTRDFSFAFADLLDFNFMIIKSSEHFGLSGISDPEQREDQAIEKLHESILSFSDVLVKALDEFLDGLTTELGI